MTDHHNRKILIIHTSMASFIAQDISLLKKYFKIETLEFPNSTQKFSKFITGIIHTIKNTKTVIDSDALVVWFADVHTFWGVLLSKIFKKKLVIIVGGYDVACEPEINYGMCTENKIRQVLSRFALNNADILLPVSYNTKRECYRFIYHAVPCVVVYHGVPVPSYGARYSARKDNIPPIILTVGAVKSSNLKRKGIEMFIKASRLLHHLQFIVVGKIMDDSINYLKSISGGNVTFTGFLSGEMLEEYYQKARVYVQVSYHEGFGCSLAEAMLRECVPVVSQKGALPEVVGNTGIYADHKDEKSIANAILVALSNPKLGKKAKIRVIRRFSVKMRETKLRKYLEKVLADEGMYRDS